MSARPRLAALALLGAVAGCAAGGGRGVARLALGAEADAVCVAHCAASVQAQISRLGDSLPLEPPQLVACGEDIVFDELPAGLQVIVEVDVVGVDGGTLLRGTSAPVTIVADGAVDVLVMLAPTDPPTIAAVAPDPVVPAADARVTITGSGFGQAQDGDSGVSLGASALPVVGWAAEAVSAEVLASQAGALSVRRCGVESAPYELRVVATAGPGAATVAQAPGCTGRAFVGAAREAGADDAVVVAARCDDAASGYLQRFRADLGCPLAGREVFALGRNPGALAVDGGTAYVALTDEPAIARVDVGAGGASGDVALVGGGRALAVAARAGLAFAIVDDGGATSLVAVETGVAEAVPGVDAGLELAALAWDSRRLLVTARAGAGGKLVGVPVDGGAIVSWSLAGCAAPGALGAAADDRVVIACGGEDHALGVFDSGTGRLALLPLDEGAAPEAIAFDAVGDAFLANDPATGALLVGHLGASGAELLAALAPAPEGARLVLLGGGGSRFLATSAELVVLTPYEPDGPCADAGGAP